MSTTTSRSHATSFGTTATHRQDSFAELATHWLALIAKRLAEAGRIRKDVRRLSAMDDRLLSDIGISRSEIEHAVHAGRRERS
jgi:uncharacterized protein YjiS (DUF1127 family)